MIKNIKYLGNIIAIKYRNNRNEKGLRFITEPKSPIQVAFHNYLDKKITNIHKTGLRKPVTISEFHKTIYMIEGAAIVYLMKDEKEIIKKVKLIQGDCIIIMNTFHKVVFNENSNAIEIKQGPYSADT